MTRYLDFGDLQSYEKDLYKWDSEWTLRLYTEILKREMDKACDRKQYRDVASHLSKLEAYPNGLGEARSLTDYRYRYHKNRPAVKKTNLKRRDIPRNNENVAVTL